MKFSLPLVVLFLPLTCLAGSDAPQGLTTNMALCHQTILRHRADERDATTVDINYSNREAIKRRALSCKAALQVLRDDAVALNNIGIDIIENGPYPLSQENTKLAENLFSQAVAIQPNYQEAISNLADAYFAQGRAANAIELMESNASRNPSNPVALGLLGSALHTDGQFERAVLVFQKAVAIDPAFATAWQALAFEYLSLGQWEKAIHAATKAVEIDPNYTGAWIDLKLAFQGTGRISDARRVVARIRELAPSSPQARLDE